MPPRWIHEAIDIIAFGRSYWQLHQFKDAPWRKLGPHHRTIHHEWYHRFGTDWDHESPFPEPILSKTRTIRDSQGPETAEEFQAWISHDYIDRVWDELSAADRRGVAGTFRQILLDPPFLLKWAEVDVIQGRIKVRYGPEEGYVEPVDRWEDELSLRRAYQTLRNYLESTTIDELLYQAP